MESVYVAVNPHEKAMQRALIQYRDPKNYDLVLEALHKAGRTDLIGFEKHCLIPPRKMKIREKNGKKQICHTKQKTYVKKTQEKAGAGYDRANDQKK